MTGRDDAALVRASGSMAVATLVSRLTGFVRTIALAATIGLTLVNSSYTVANTLPNIVYELLLGGVLTSVVVPLLVRAQQEDTDGGEAYTQRLLTMATVLLVLTTGVALAVAPWMTRLYVDSSTGRSDPVLATHFAYLLLPEILFYGLGALFQAILNAKHVFGVPAWAPVLNNLVVIGTVGVYALLPGIPQQITTTQVLVLGIGTTLGIVVQAVVLVPAVVRGGFRFRPRWGWDRRLSEFGGLALWVVGYAAVSQIGYVVINRVATAASGNAIAIYSYAWLLLQMPYGIIGVSLLTAIMPRMSKAAADGDTVGVIANLSQGSRLSAVMLVPISALLTVLGTPLCIALLSLKGGVDDATALGETLAISAFGLLPFAVVMLQLRVFYALKDSRTPTLIMVIMTVVKVPLCYLVAARLPPDQVVFGLAFVNSLGFVVGMVAGEFWLRARLGRLGSRRWLTTAGKALVASLWGCAAVYAVIILVGMITSGGSSVKLRSWLSLTFGGGVGLVCTFAVMGLLRVDEMRPALNRITRLLRRG